MKKPKLRGHIRASYVRLRTFIRSRLPSSVSTHHAASTPPQSTQTSIPPQENGNVDRTVDISIRNVENSFSSPDYIHGTVSFDTRSTQTVVPSQEHEAFVRRVEIHFRDGENSCWPPHYIHGVVLFDTGSTYNLVTRQFLEDNGVEWQPSISATSIVQLGDDKIQFLGEVQGRWYPLKHDKDDTFRPRYEICTFKVVDSNNFDLIIGSITINELRLVQLNPRFFANFRGRRPPVEPASITIEKQQELEQKRQKEQEEMRKAEEEARKAKASNSHSR
ncbi:hypothetical protein yc1106_03870 [Curvularia clavata]|uniref:Uncharacterized protein n=1 Tax=Curvularia clavata TaxID=95742 RepID=A0A9Q9DSM7_CURCL|nr:hypothetical protein yc1106_03870 [Curvularia clavata]